MRELPIFADCITEIELSFIVNNLKTQIYLPDDEVIRQGDFGNKMFFIGNGEVDVFLTIYSKKKLDENSMKQGPEKKKIKGKKKYVLFEGGHNEEEHHNF